ncbi:MAG: hypothetical protein M0P01_14355 [Treponema sp.]|nr:hypothetical protein [Treponema sp.]
MTASKIFFDTTPIIYFLDDDIHYADKVEQIISSFMAQKAKYDGFKTVDSLQPASAIF